MIGVGRADPERDVRSAGFSGGRNPTPPSSSARLRSLTMQDFPGGCAMKFPIYVVNRKHTASFGIVSWLLAIAPLWLLLAAATTLLSRRALLHPGCRPSAPRAVATTSPTRSRSALTRTCMSPVNSAQRQTLEAPSLLQRATGYLRCEVQSIRRAPVGCTSG